MPALLIRLAKKTSQLSEDGGDESMFEHKAVAGALHELDRIAREMGVVKLSQFISEDRDNVCDLIDDVDEAASVMSKLAPVRWSEPVEAMPTITKLIDHLAKGSEVPGIKDPEKVVADLRDFETILNYCTAKKAKFRFYQEF